MRVVCWNVRHGSAGPRRGVDLVRTGVELEAMAPDVAALQEVDRATMRSWRVDQAAALAGVAGLHATFGRARGLLGGGDVGNAVLSRHRPRSTGTRLLPTGGEARVLVWALVPGPPASGPAASGPAASGPAGVPAGGAADVAAVPPWVTVASTHLQHRRGAPTREAPAQLRACLDLLGAVDGPVVLCGDLNLDGAEVLPALAAAGFTAAPTGPTYPAGRPRRRIDWVAVRGLAVVAAHVAPVRASDHRPVVVDLAPHPAGVLHGGHEVGRG